MFYVDSAGGHYIVLTTHSGWPALVYLSSVLVQRMLLPLQASDPRAFGLYVPGVVSPRLGEGKYTKKKKKKMMKSKDPSPWRGR